MLNRPFIKQNAKRALASCYIKAVAVSFLLMIALYGFSFSGGVSSGSSESTPILSIVFEDTSASVMGFMTMLIVMVLVLSLLISIFVFNPLEIGCRKFFTCVYTEVPVISTVLSPFSSSYLNQVKTMFFRDLYTILWTLLFIIPGIVKAYSYRMIPYLLAEDPSLDTSEAFRLSKQMMDGYKMEAFIYDLTFIGWYILGGITCGIAAIFYVYPYKDLSDAGLYLYLKEKQAFD